ncbi:MAG: hypothetical protein FJ313_07315, partial [Gemmatimonadetes bacterium]|nr:hypothetical protein [Gemmatimonadota bacterium]
MSSPERAASHLVADLHLHSRFSSRASRHATLQALAGAARAKGIDLLATGDFTHPDWLAELRSGLSEAGEGVYAHGGVRFVLGTEVSCIWEQAARGRRVHLLVLAQGFRTASAIRHRLCPHGDLRVNGRPHLKISAERLASLVWDADPLCVVIPAHVWTPWYGAFGSKSGFDSLDECFGEAASGIRAVETGLSSDPAMNWRIRQLDGRAIVSFSDAHSPAKLGRELTVFDAEPTFPALRGAIERGAIVETVEFHPEHGKYHYDGHRSCRARLHPRESREAGGTCPRCGRPLTLGVLHRVEDLAAREVTLRREAGGLLRGPAGRPPFRTLLPLRELLSQALGAGTGSKRVTRLYEALASELGGEYRVLAAAPRADLEAIAGPAVAAAVCAVREGHLTIEPGYDGAWGKVSIQ